MNKQTLGTCSICGGVVTVDTIYWSVVPPVPKCEGCGATKDDHGPVIDMKPAAPMHITTGTTYDLQFPKDWKR